MPTSPHPHSHTHNPAAGPAAVIPDGMKDPFENLTRPVPPEVATLDDAVLVYASDEHGEEAVTAPRPDQMYDDTGCCHQTIEADGVDSAPYTEVIFKGERRGYYLNTLAAPLARDTWVLVEAEKGLDLGIVGCTGHDAYLKTRMRLRPCEEAPKKVVRLAEEQDMRILSYHREQERTAFAVCLDRIHMFALPMKLVDVEFQYDRNRITFYFTADGRVDFRELVRSLAGEYRTRIELRQIGPRDEARRMGGYGVCGRELCCNSWLGNFEPISTDMARLQNLALNPFKLAGQCGRLKCCLAYELQVYEELLRKFPPLEYTFQTPKGVARIEKIDIFQDAIYVHYQKSDGWDRMTLEQVRAFIPEPAGS